MRYLTIAGLLLLAQLSCLPALAAPDAPAKSTTKLTPAQLKDAHKVAAKKLLDVLNAGVVLKGTEVQNGTDGQFEAYFYQGSSLVREIFGQIQNQFYRGPEGAYAGTNFSLPYQVNPADSPADTVLNLLSDGTYLEDPYWSQFTYIGEVASGYVYYVSLKGVTGAGHLDIAAVAEAVPRIKAHVSVPVGVGFGIRDAARTERG